MNNAVRTASKATVFRVLVEVISLSYYIRPAVGPRSPDQLYPGTDHTILLFVRLHGCLALPPQRPRGSHCNGKLFPRLVRVVPLAASAKIWWGNKGRFTEDRRTGPRRISYNSPP